MHTPLVPPKPSAHTHAARDELPAGLFPLAHLALYRSRPPQKCWASHGAHVLPPSGMYWPGAQSRWPGTLTTMSSNLADVVSTPDDCNDVRSLSPIGSRLKLMR